MNQLLTQATSKIFKKSFPRVDHHYCRLILNFHTIITGQKRFLDIIKIQTIQSNQGQERVLLLGCYGKLPFEMQFQTPQFIHAINNAMGFSYIQKIKYYQKSKHPKPSFACHVLPENKPNTLEDALERLEQARNLKNKKMIPSCA
jgi:hypothetical protein